MPRSIPYQRKLAKPETLLLVLKRYAVMHMGKKRGGICIFDRDEKKLVAIDFETFSEANERAAQLNKRWLKKYQKNA